jgi:hypothetical protein
MRLSRRALFFLAASWVVVVLYPDPTLLVRSVRNIVSPGIDPAAVSALAARLPADPALIESYVLERQVPYAYDWQSAGVPWYFPTTAEVLRAGRGDCESRALVLAAILTAKGIPNELRVSLDHIWVDYPGKRATAMENPGVELAGRRDGRFFLHWPSDFELGREVADQVAMYWTPAPAGRVLLLVAGLSLVALWNALAALLAGAPALPVGAGRPRGRPGGPARGRRRTRAGRRGPAGLATRPQRV